MTKIKVTVGHTDGSLTIHQCDNAVVYPQNEVYLYDYSLSNEEVLSVVSGTILSTELYNFLPEFPKDTRA
jgi:hypothetical protein